MKLASSNKALGNVSRTLARSKVDKDKRNAKHYLQVTGRPMKRDNGRAQNAALKTIIPR